MKKILVIPSDRRQDFIKQYFDSRGYCCEISKEKSDLKSARAVILPIPSLCNGKIRSTDMTVHEFSEILDDNCVVFAFCLKDDVLTRELKARNILCFDLYQSGELAVSNAYATAQGVLKYILLDTNKLLRETKVLLSGYGKTGRAICETLSLNKAEVTVLARREELRSELREKNIKSFSYDEKENIGNGFDYLINTVESRVIGAHFIKKVKNNGKILEIASRPYGTDFEQAEKLGIQYEILPSLPSSAAPESAGKFMAKAVEKKIEEMIEEGKLWKT